MKLYPFDPANIEAAVRDYNEFSKDYLVFADIQAYDMFTKRPLTGTFEIVGALNPQTLIFKGQDTRLHTLGKNFQADTLLKRFCAKKEILLCLNPKYRCEQSNPCSNVSTIDTTAENYFFGDLLAMDKVALPENIKLFSPVTGSSNTISSIMRPVEDNLHTISNPFFISKGISYN